MQSYLKLTENWALLRLMHLLFPKRIVHHHCKTNSPVILDTVCACLYTCIYLYIVRMEYEFVCVCVCVIFWLSEGCVCVGGVVRNYEGIGFGFMRPLSN